MRPSSAGSADSGRTGQVGLVLNGDVIDSLAEDTSGYVAADEAETMMTRIFDDQAFAPIWDALTPNFVRQSRAFADHRHGQP
ncbi:MAG: hypothetical protein MZV70_34755 [Desulfobacterales bacterium]|nr:hypothetical protein [Desulfobacterales bacterium]